MRIRSRVAVLAIVAGVAALFTVAGSSASAGPRWAPAATATVHPGVQTRTNGAQCTANFIFADASDVYIGQAAHCSGTGGATATDGCQSRSLPLGTQVQVRGASRPGTLVYNSWVTMRAVRETNRNTCAFNDFALVKLDPADHGRVNPSIPFWGGPTGLGNATTALEQVYSYGNSGLRLGLRALSPKTGSSLGTNGGGWNHPVYTGSPGIPGDSGSAFLDSDGKAVGVLSTLTIAPLAGSNGVTDLERALAYMEAHTALDVALVRGTERFSPIL